MAEAAALGSESLSQGDVLGTLPLEAVSLAVRVQLIQRVLPEVRGERIHREGAELSRPTGHTTHARVRGADAMAAQPLDTLERRAAPGSGRESATNEAQTGRGGSRRLGANPLTALVGLLHGLDARIDSGGLHLHGPGGERGAEHPDTLPREQQPRSPLTALGAASRGDLLDGLTEALGQRRGCASLHRIYRADIVLFPLLSLGRRAGIGSTAPLPALAPAPQRE